MVAALAQLEAFAVAPKTLVGKGSTHPAPQVLARHEEEACGAVGFRVVHEVYRALLARGLAASDVVLAGDSAGGNLALALQLALRDERIPQARALALVSPWLDLTASQPSCRANDAYDYGQTSFLLKHARDFAQAVPLDDSRVSLLHADLRGLAPLLVSIGGAERLHDEAVEFVARATRVGVRAELAVAPDMPHNPPILADYHPAAKASLERLAQYIRDALR